MIQVTLIAGTALFLAIGIGALLASSRQAFTASPHDWPWRYFPANVATRDPEFHVQQHDRIRGAATQPVYSPTKTACFGLPAQSRVAGE